MTDKHQQARRIGEGDFVAERELTTITGAPVLIPDAEQLVHLQFRRFAGCPICNLHFRSLVERRDDIAAAGIREVILSHSSAEDLRLYQEEMPFDVVADPSRRLYREFGVESSARALLHPGAWAPAVKGFFRKRRPLTADHRSGHLGLPADFLIAPDGRVVAGKYGEHAYDQWPVDTLLELAHGAQVRTAPTTKAQ